MTTQNTFLHRFQHPVFFMGYSILIIIAYFFWDRPVALFFHQLVLSSHMDLLVHAINDLGLGWIYVFGLPVAAFISLTRFKKPHMTTIFVFLWACVLFSGIICDILKMVLGRARPELFFSQDLYGFFWFQFNMDSYYWSFPSGHTTVITAIMAGLSAIKPRYTFFFMAIALIICSMRIVLTQHYISDVMAAIYLAIFSVNKLHAFYQKKRYNLPTDFQF